MPNPTLKQIVETFTENELNLTVPIDFQDVNGTDFPIVKQYNTYLANGEYDTALQYRANNNAVLDKYIFDAKKINMLQALVINAYLFAKAEKSAVNTSFDNEKIKEICEATNVQDALDACFTSVSNGKALLASAITDKKVFTDADTSFKKLAENIGKIALGSGNATTEDVLNGKTFTNDDGIEYIGTMTDNQAVIKTLAAGQIYTIPAGYHNGNGTVTANSLASQTSATATAANIQSGKTAWVNGIKITGSAKIAPSSLSGKDVYWQAWEAVTRVVTFSTPFASAPKVNASGRIVDSGGTGKNLGINITNITKAGFTYTTNEPPNYGDVTVTWNAVI